MIKIWLWQKSWGVCGSPREKRKENAHQYQGLRIFLLLSLVDHLSMRNLKACRNKDIQNIRNAYIFI